MTKFRTRETVRKLQPFLRYPPSFFEAAMSLHRALLVVTLLSLTAIALRTSGARSAPSDDDAVYQSDYTPALWLDDFAAMRKTTDGMQITTHVKIDGRQVYQATRQDVASLRRALAALPLRPKSAIEADFVMYVYGKYETTAWYSGVVPSHDVAMTH